MGAVLSGMFSSGIHLEVLLKLLQGAPEFKNTIVHSNDNFKEHPLLNKVIVEHFMAYVKNEADRKRCRLVCRAWNREFDKLGFKNPVAIKGVQGLRTYHKKFSKIKNTERVWLNTDFNIASPHFSFH